MNHCTGLVTNWLGTLISNPPFGNFLKLDTGILNQLCLFELPLDGAPARPPFQAGKWHVA